MVTFLQSLDSSRRKPFGESSTLGKVLLVMPPTSDDSERSFSPLKPVKTYSRPTTGDSRLNHLMMLLVYKDRRDALTLLDFSDDFVRENESQTQLFGKFSANGVAKKFQ